MNKLLKILEIKGISDKRVLAAMAKIPRDLFVEANWLEYSYEDIPLPIGYEQTISQPFIVAKMTELILPKTGYLPKVLEIGTGSGYQSSILAKLADNVYTIERIQALAEKALKRFKLLELNNIHVLHNDGNQGWSEHAPYNAIIVTAAAKKIPPTLLDQLAIGGRMLIPIGSGMDIQMLQLIVRKENDYQITQLDSVRFVPLLTGTL